MKLDSDKKFGDLYPSIEALQIAVRELETKYKETVSDTQIPLRFLTLRDGPPLEPPGNTVSTITVQAVSEVNADFVHLLLGPSTSYPESGIRSRLGICCCIIHLGTT